jgi:molecular chaperone DnaJ
MINRDYYAELGVPRNASKDEIGRSFRKLAAKYHPDRNPGDKEAEDKFKKVAEAYQVLSDPKSREAYDRGGEERVQMDTGFRGFGSTEDVFSQFGDVFGDLFGDRVHARRPPPERGHDLQMELQLSLEEAAAGGLRTFTIDAPSACDACRGTGTRGGAPVDCGTCRGSGYVNRRAKEHRSFFSVSSPCPGCGGSGRAPSSACEACGGTGTVVRPRTIELTIPPALEDGATLRVRGMGAAGSLLASAGDLWVSVRISKHPYFERDGLHLKRSIDVDLATALLGGKKTVPLLRGTAEMAIPPGTQPGQQFRLSGQGLRDAQGRSGDLIVTAQVKLPRDLTEEQKRVIRQLQSSPR